MALGQVSVSTSVSGAPTFAEPEGVGLFIGTVASGARALQAIGPDTDLEALFGAAGNLADTLEAARLNGGPHWKAWAIGHSNHAVILAGAAVDEGGGKVGLPSVGHGFAVGSTVVVSNTTNYNGSYSIEAETTADKLVITAVYQIETFASPDAAAVDEDWADVLAQALLGGDPEFLVICPPITAGSALTDLQTELTAQLNVNRRLFALAAFRGIDNTPSTGDADWSAYIAAAQAITADIDAVRVLAVPLLFGNELGAFAGRLQKVLDEAAPRISRSPMRVASGAVVDPGAARGALVDATGALLSLTHLALLDTARFSVFQWYEGRAGVYCADGNLLVPSGSGEPPVIEWLRVLDKAARRIRQLAIGAIADDQVVNTPAGNAAFATRLSLPLRQMVGLGEIKPLGRTAVTVSWLSVTQVKVAFTIQPPNAPKSISAEIVLDTTAA